MQKKYVRRIGLALTMATVGAAIYVAPVFAKSGTHGVSALVNPSQPSVVYHGPLTPELAKQLNKLISIAWNSPFTNRAAIIAKGGTYTISNPFGIDTSKYRYDVNTGAIVGLNPGYNQPMGYGESCSGTATYYTTKRVTVSPNICGQWEAPSHHDHH